MRINEYLLSGAYNFVSGIYYISKYLRRKLYFLTKYLLKIVMGIYEKSNCAVVPFLFLICSNN